MKKAVLLVSCPLLLAAPGMGCSNAQAEQPWTFTTIADARSASPSRWTSGSRETRQATCSCLISRC